MQEVNKTEETYCPACGHFSGVYEYCPRCGTYIPKRISIKFFKYFSLCLGIVGLLCLYLWVTNRELEKIRISEITETMNFAYVRIQGTVTREGRVYYDEAKQPSGLNFSLSDGSGEIRVVAYKHNAEKLIEKKLLPRKGDLVDVEGQLRVKADQNISLMIQAADQFTLRRVPPQKIPLKDLAQHLNKEVQISATISAIKIPGPNSRAPITIELTQDQKKAALVMWRQLYEQIQTQASPQVGSQITVRVQVNDYRGRVQMRLLQAEDLQIGKQSGPGQKNNEQRSPEKPRPEKQEVRIIKQIKDIQEKDCGKSVQIKAKIAYVKEIPPGYKLLVSDSSAKIAVILWNRLFRGNPALKKLETDTVIRVTGRVESYNGKLQVQPERVEQLVVLGAAAPDFVLGNIGEMDRKHLGFIVKVRGKVFRKHRVQPGFKLLIADATGKTAVMLWDRVFQNSKIPWLIERDQMIEVTGLVAEHRQRLQIQPKKEKDIKILATGGAQVTTSQKGEEKSPSPVKKTTPIKKKPTPSPVVDKPTPTPTEQGKTIEIDAPEVRNAVPIPAEEQKLQREYLDFVAYLKPEHSGKLVQFKGNILSKQNIPPGLKLVFQDRSGRIDIVLLRERFKHSKLFYKIGPGYLLRVKAKVTEHQGRLQLQPRGLTDIEILALPERKKTERKSGLQAFLQPEFLDKAITIRGELLRIQEIKIGKRLVLVDGQMRVDIILPQDKFAGQPILQNLANRQSLEVTGKLDKFRNRFQIKVQSPAEIKIIQAAKSKPAQTAERKKPIALTEIAALQDKQYMHKWVALEATVVDRHIIPPGLKFLLKDAGSLIELVIRTRLLHDMEKFKVCVPGSKIKIIAKVSEYRGRVQLELKDRKDFTLVKVGENPLKAQIEEPARDAGRSEREIHTFVNNFAELGAKHVGAYLVLTGTLQRGQQDWQLSLGDKTIVVRFPENFSGEKPVDKTKIRLQGTLLQLEPTATILVDKLAKTAGK